MEWIDRLHGHTVAIDTAPFIYFMESHPAYITTLRHFFTALHAGEFTGSTSTITLTEVLVHPLRSGHHALCKRYREILLTAKHFRIIPVTHDIAEKAAEIRAVYGFRTPDAIQAATAHYAKADYLLTNDKKLAHIRQPEVLVLHTLVP
jgi:predicted nucleic acid-binding protein